MRRRLPEHGLRSFIRQPSLLSVLLFWTLVPDLDAIPGLLAGDLGRFHNNSTHSLVVAAILSGIMAVILWWFTRYHLMFWFLSLFFSYASHIILDFFTYSERGMMLLWPFDSARYESGVTLFYGVRWSEGLLSAHHLVTLVSELAIFGLVMAVLWVWGKRKSQLSRCGSE
jgi:inner membrane protein